MGLDFTLYWKHKNETCSDAWKTMYDNEGHWVENWPRELCYGRKSWELVYKLCPVKEDGEYDFGHSDSEGNWEDPIVSLEAWNSLMAKITPIGNKLDEVAEAFEIVEFAPEDYPEMVITDEVKRTIAEYEVWWRKTFRTEACPTLGFDFSVGYMKSFWDAHDKVRRYIEDPEYEVRASVSY